MATQNEDREVQIPKKTGNFFRIADSRFCIDQRSDGAESSEHPDIRAQSLFGAGDRSFCDPLGTSF